MKKTLLLCLIGAQLVSCGGSQTENPVDQKPTYRELKKAQWVIGCWENRSDYGTLTETWKRENDSVFSGESYFVLDSDTLFGERIRLIETGGKLYYCPTIEDQNDGKETRFTLTHAAKNELIFEDPEHDYPQKITYISRNDSLIAKISGMQDGKMKEEEFAMKKAR